ncbi:N-acetyltransferase family protein [Pontiella sp.]|uniref:GNAT family N-acetyltransferase n=1 Tax=Pontiella sp. TaxID=2837462 RepID=UPI0035622EA9
MKIRTATKDDIPVMAELLHELFAIEVDFIPDYALQSEGLRLLIERDCTEIFVVEVDGHVVGMASIQINISTAKGCAVGVVEDVVIDVDHRGRGMGAALLRRLEEWATERGLARLQLLADRDNYPALGFYRRQGWHPTNLTSWMKHL